MWICVKGAERKERKPRLVRANNGLPIIGLGLWPALVLLLFECLINLASTLNYLTNKMFALPKWE